MEHHHCLVYSIYHSSDGYSTLNTTNSFVLVSHVAGLHLIAVSKINHGLVQWMKQLWTT